MINGNFKASNGYMRDSYSLMGASIVKWTTVDHYKSFSESDLELCTDIQFVNRIVNI